MTDPIYGKSIAVGVSGSIACYKAIDLISKLVQAGAAVDVMMTKASLQFVTPNSFASITNPSSEKFITSIEKALKETY